MSNTTETRVHHPYSPSTLQNLEACPCYLSNHDGPVHERTTAGTKAHAVAESGVDDNTLGDEDAAAAAECLDFVEHHRRLMEDARQRDIIKLAVDLQKIKKGNEEQVEAIVSEGFPPILEIKEAYLPVDDLVFPDFVHATTAGYIDHGLIDHTGTKAKLFDWKFGMWAVEAANNNLQGMAYTLALVKKYPRLEEVEFFFKQPHLGTVSSAMFKRSDLAAIYLRIQLVVSKARAARAAILKNDWSLARPMVPACNFCANLGKCPAVSSIAAKLGHKFFPLEIPDNITPTMIHSTRDTTLALRLSQVVGVWAKAFKTQVTDRIIRGEADVPPGHVLQQRSEREIADEKKYKEIALQHVTQAQYEDACTVGFGKIEAAIRDKAPRGSKKEAVEVFNKKLEDEGAVKRCEPYTFLRVSSKETDK